MTSYSIVFEDVYKTYRRGGVAALRAASLHIPRGAVAGLVGPNGAGKTTTLKLALGLLRRDRGTVLVEGMDPEREERRVREAAGFLPERPIYPQGVTVEEYLVHVARLRGLPAGEARRAARLLGIEHLMGRPIGVLSRGYLQRLGLAQALIGEPRVLLLDEPAANLDPAARAEILGLIRSLSRDSGATALVSSHILPELQQIADYLVIMSKGRVVAEGPVAELAKRYGATLVYHVETPEGGERRLAQLLIGDERVSGVVIHSPGLLEVHASPAAEELLARLHEEGLVRSYRVYAERLEQLYTRIIPREQRGREEP